MTWGTMYLLNNAVIGEALPRDSVTARHQQVDEAAGLHPLAGLPVGHRTVANHVPGRTTLGHAENRSTEAAPPHVSHRPMK